MKVLDDFDFTPRTVEKSEELDAVAWAENHGWVVRKISYVGRTSCPDRLFVGYGELHLIEMKKPSDGKRKAGRLSPGQKEEFKRLADVGVTVQVFYTAADAIAFLQGRMLLV